MNEAQTEAVAARGHYGPRSTVPAVRCGYLDGEYVAYVQLSGLGHGREMILSADKWTDVATRWGRSWLLVNYPDGERIIGTSARLERITGIRRPRLSRLLTDAKPNQRVKHRNGNTLDLRDSNLIVVDLPPKTPKAPRPPRKAAQPKVPTVELTPTAKLSLDVLKLRLRSSQGRAGTNAEVVENALRAALAALPQRTVGETKGH